MLVVMSKIVIAIDGTAASGKGTLSRKLADILGFAYLDTGKLYRYLGHEITSQGLDPSSEDDALAIVGGLLDKGIEAENLQNPALQTDEAGRAASMVSVFPDVRKSLISYQRNFAQNPPGEAKGTILDGRDIGTVICPAADLKLYVTAKIEIRAKRRHKELQSSGITGTYEAVLADMCERDARDAGRKEAPMKPADDAIILDTSEFGIDEVLEKALSLIEEKLGIEV
jgi:cytidylate kinase